MAVWHYIIVEHLVTEALIHIPPSVETIIWTCFINSFTILLHSLEIGFAFMHILRNASMHNFAHDTPAVHIDTIKWYQYGQEPGCIKHPFHRG